MQSDITRLITGRIGNRDAQMFLAWKKIAQCFAVALLISMAAESKPALAQNISGEDLNTLNDALKILEKEVPNAEANIPSAAVKKAEDDLDAKAIKNLKTPKENKQEKDKAQKEEDEAKKAADDAKANEKGAGQKKADAYRDALGKIRQARITVETLSPKIKLGGTFSTDELRNAKGRSTTFLQRIKKLLETRPTAMRTDSPPGSGTELATKSRASSPRGRRPARLLERTTNSAMPGGHCPGSVAGADLVKRDPDSGVMLAMVKECGNWNGAGGR